MLKKNNLLIATSVIGLVIANQAVAQVNEDTAGTLTPQTNIDAFYGNIDALGGNIDAFWGNIDAFFGNIDAFYGNIDAFFGNIDAFGGNIDAFGGNIDAFWGNIDAFWGDVDAQWGNIDAFWGNIDAFTDDEFNEFSDMLDDMFTDAEATFGTAFENATGTTFEEGFKKQLLEKYGLDLSDAQTFSNASKEDRVKFFIEFYDGLMFNSGINAPDHWMPKISWSPSISQNAGGGSGVTVGLLDTPITNEALVGGKVVKSKGFGLSSVDHGAGVASILAGAHDGRGVMGVAPDANFTVYNPFDQSFTSNWGDVTKGVTDLGKRGASVINMSLGVDGFVLHQGWTDVFDNKQVVKRTGDVVFVKSAGNSGATQFANIDFTGIDVVDRLLIVGSVDSAGSISSFSNRPGEACIIFGGKCSEENKLKYRFIVAPGELIAVEDNKGNVSRASGTSLAAPQVSGAIALLQSRWGWLKDNPVETADIILRTATDLGDPGVDAVYGHGLLNVEASQAPINTDALYLATANGNVSLSDIGFDDQLIGLVNTDETVTAYENIGDTYRDFNVPVSSLSIQSSSPEAVQQTASEEYLSAQTAAVSPSSNKKAKKNKKNKKKLSSFSNLRGLPTHISGSPNANWRMSMIAHPRDREEVYADGALPYTTGMILENQQSGLTLRAGQGNSIMSLTNSSQFGRQTDYDINTGGANPLMGLASGGSYAAASVPINDIMGLSVSYTENDDKELYRVQSSGELMRRYDNLEAYKSNATSLQMNLQPNELVTLNLSAIRLREENALYGGQGVGSFALDGGTQTTAASIEITAFMTSSLSLALTGTIGETEAAQASSGLLKVSEDGIRSTAYAASLEKTGLLSRNDAVRLSVSQPLSAVDGALVLTDTKVVDRETGERQQVETVLDLDGMGPRYVGELLYGRPILDGTGTMSAFGQIQSRGVTSTENQAELAAGLRLGLTF